jgi:uncharacterized protein YllA (UPF0747 family)
MIRLLQKSPLNDPAARHLRDHSDGSALFPGGSLASETAVRGRAEHLRGWSGNRAALRAWLAEQNAFAPLSPQQQNHLAAAENPDALFLLTGQQPALLGGPLLWFCKAQTCAGWARALERSEKASLGRILQGKEPWLLSLRVQRK